MVYVLLRIFDSHRRPSEPDWGLHLLLGGQIQFAEEIQSKAEHFRRPKHEGARDARPYAHPQTSRLGRLRHAN